jgi:hypothetical protein
MEATLKKDINDLGTLRQTLAIDLEQAKLDRENVDVDRLRKTEKQLASMSDAVRAVSDDPLQLVAPKEPPPPGKVNIDEMLK